MIKLTGKRTDFYQADFCERLMYFQRLHYRIKHQLQNKFQVGNSVIEAKQLLGNLVYEEKKRFAVRKCGHS